MRRGIVEPAACRSLHDFGGAERARLFDAGIRNALLVEQPDGRLLSGVAGLRLLLAHGGRRRTAALLGLAPVRALAEFLYRIVATNRRVLAPIDAAERAACDCDPEPRAGSRLVFVGLCFVLALAGTAGLGALLGSWSGWGVGRGALAGLAFPVVLALPALLCLPYVARTQRGELLAHVAWQTLLAVKAGAQAGGALILAWAVVLGTLFLLALAFHWGAALALFASLFQATWPTILLVAVLAAMHAFVLGLQRRLRSLGGDA